MDFEDYAVTQVSSDRCEGKSGRHDGALTLAAGPETTVEIMLLDGNPNLLDSKQAS